MGAESEAVQLVELPDWDDEILEELYQIELKSHIDPWTKDSIAGSMEMPYNHTMALYCGEKMVGYSLYSVVAGESELYTIGIMPEYQGRGFGHLLLHETLERAQKEGAEQCFLEVRVTNAVAIHLYKYYGFESIGVRRNYYAATATTPSEDAYVMQANLTELVPLPQRLQR